MSVIAKTIVATGASSGLGFEAIRQLLTQTVPYTFILGARDTTQTQAAYDALQYDSGTHSVVILPLELSDLKTVRTFAQQALNTLGDSTLDYLFLNAASAKGAPAGELGRHGSKWCEPYIVNHLSHHYLLHLLRAKLAESQSRVVIVSSGAIRNLRDEDPSTIDADLKCGSGADGRTVYPASKFAQLLGAHWWRRELKECKVIVASPGFIPNTGLLLGSGVTDEQVKQMTMGADAKTLAEGGHSLLLAFTKDDFPEDTEQIFLTSWGEWWSKDNYASTLDRELQKKWTPSKEEIEEQEGLGA